MRMLAALSVLVLAAAAHAAPGDQQNAATWYRRAFERYDALDPDRVQAVLDWSNGDTTRPPPPDIAATLGEAQGIFDDFRRAGRCTVCDFDLDYSQGFELLLPHLAYMRGIARLAAANGLASIQAGNPSAAALDAAAIYRAGAHVPNDRVLISGLVGQAVFATAERLVDLSLAQGALQPDELRTIYDAVDAMPATDPFLYAESVAMERMITMEWLPRLVEGNDDPIGSLGAIMGAGDLPLELAPIATPEGIRSALEPYDAAMAEVQAAFEMEDSEAAMAALESVQEKVEAGEFGPLARILLPAFGKVLARRDDGERMIAERREMLAKMLGGELRVDSQLDAALEYLRLAERLDDLPPEQLVRLAGRDALDPEDAKAWTSLREGLDLASTRLRCDFRPYRGYGSLWIAPPETPGLRALLDLLLVDARRCVVSADPGAAADRLATVIAATAQWSNDNTVGVAMVAHDAFERAVGLVEDLRAADLLDDERRAQLHAALHRVPRRDPFGYLAATQTLRETMRGRLQQMAIHADLRESEDFATIASVSGGSDPDELLSIAAALEWMSRESDPRRLQAIAASDSLVPSMIDRAGLDAARAQAGAVGMHLVQGNLDLRDGTIAWPVVAPLRERTYEARLDVRRAQWELGREE